MGFENHRSGIRVEQVKFFCAMSRKPLAWKTAKELGSECGVCERSITVYLRKYWDLGLCEIGPVCPPRYRFREPSTQDGQQFVALLKQAADVFGLTEESQS